MSIRRSLYRFLFPVATLIVAAGIGLNDFTTVAAAPTPAPNDTVQITLSPTKQRVDISPGATTKGTFTIRNTGKTPFSFKVYAAPYTVTSDANYTPGFTQETPRTQINRWISFAKTAYLLQPDASVEVPYSITVPTSIPAGSQYAAIFAETDGQNAGSVITKKRVGMLVYAKPKGTTKSSGNVDFNTISPIIIGSLLTSTAKVTNTGNTDFDTTVRLEQKTVFGGNNQTTEQIRTVLPETTRTVDLTTRSLAPVASYTVTQSATVNGKVFSKITTVYVISPLVAFFAAALVFLLIMFGAWRAIIKIRKKS